MPLVIRQKQFIAAPDCDLTDRLDQLSVLDIAHGFFTEATPELFHRDRRAEFESGREMIAEDIRQRLLRRHDGFDAERFVCLEQQGVEFVGIVFAELDQKNFARSRRIDLPPALEPVDHTQPSDDLRHVSRRIAVIDAALMRIVFEQFREIVDGGI